MSSGVRGWKYQGPAANRLWHKSGLGKIIAEDILFLTDAEVIFCHDHRNIEWPYDDWMNECMNNNPKILDEYTILESLRKPGNKIMIVENANDFDFDEDVETWGLRWPSDVHPREAPPISEIRWFHSSESLEIENLCEWSNRVSKKDRIAEVLVVDNELAVVTYRIQILNPKGDIKIPDINDYEEICNLENSVKLNNGNTFISINDTWKWENIGIPYPGGRILDREIQEVIECVSSGEKGKMSTSGSIVFDLINRGLHPRPGFKYGTKWRCYDTILGESHAPWLVVHPDNGPVNWEEACLASRLAAGVNKKWLYPIENEGWSYLSITRPPADSRWNNPNRR